MRGRVVVLESVSYKLPDLRLEFKWATDHLQPSRLERLLTTLPLL